MKKKILLSLAIVAMLVCLFAISVSADTIVPSSSDEFGALTTFDEAIGRTDIGQNKNDGTIARTVLFDGTSYYTVPTTYILTKNQYESGGILLQFNYSAINAKLSKSFNKSSIIRCELPAAISLLGGDNQNFNGCGNLVEVKLSQGLRFVGNTIYKAFANCKKLVELDLSMMVIEYVNSTYSLFEYCEKLEKITLPDAYVKDGVPVNYATYFTFNGCKVLKTIENYENFFRGSTAISDKFCMDCAKLPEMKLWDGITKIGSRAFQGCASLTEIIIPDSVTVIGTTETVFASCTSLKKIVLPKQVSLGNYCFEKCTALEAVWMPSEASTFGLQVFGQCGSSLDVTFYFTTAVSTITIENAENKSDPFITALNATNGDARIQYNTPATTKCVVFFGNHTFDKSTVKDLVYTSFLKNGTYYYSCPTCDGYSEETPSAAPLFGCKGFSAAQTGNGISLGFTVDSAAIDNYTSVTGKTVKYGVFAGSQNNLGTNDIFDAAVSEKVITAEIKRTDFTAFDIKVIGFETAEQKSVSLALGAYVALTKGETTEYSYMQVADPAENAKYSFTSYDSIVNPVE